jgi:urease accessory protein
LLLIGAEPALAHVFAHAPLPGVGGFGGGILHPILVPAHALVLIALGLHLGAQPRARMVSLVLFAFSLAAGLTAIAFAVGETPAGKVLLAATLVFGALIAADWALPKLLTALLAATTGVALGLDSPPQAMTIAEGNLMLAGTGLGACALLSLAMLVAGFAHAGWPRIALRIAGSWLATIALLVLAVALVR